jgi:hypothetical protein
MKIAQTYELVRKKNVTLGMAKDFNGRWVLFWNYDGI